MKISNKWLKTYIKVDLSPEKTAEILTDTGLEVESWETIETVKGGLNGVVIGLVLTCEKHPDADKLTVTTVDIGEETPLQIVCGAPNVAAGQKVPVATIGTTLYSGEESFQIKKSKIRGVTSEGMICAEDELGLGNSHAGIMVLKSDAIIGMSAKDYFEIEDDVVYEIGLTPNRSDATSHFGVARDLAAALKSRNIIDVSAILPDVSKFAIDNNENCFKIDIIDNENCPRYSGLHIKNITVADSPAWLQNRLLSIGIRPINNIVDITNFVLFELGQPLHAFDAGKIKGNKVIIRKSKENSKFKTLDGVERTLNGNELMICNETEEMCIAGVYGGESSGVNEKTTEIFLESAYFNPVSIRKTSKYHGLKTDASFRFERGCDPDITIYALKRAALLIKEIAGGTIASDIIDEYPLPIPKPTVTIDLNNVTSLIGKEISKEQIKIILNTLGIEILEKNANTMLLSIPLFKADVTRECDVIEEILRIYGYNNVEIPANINYAYIVKQKQPLIDLQNRLSDYLADNNCLEAMNNSLTKVEYFEKFDFLSKESIVKILNPLSKELGAMRQSLLPGLLENISMNINYKNQDVRLFEFGNTYCLNNETESNDVTKRYIETQMLGMVITGNSNPETWLKQTEKNDFYTLKGLVNGILKKSSIKIEEVIQKPFSDSIFSNGLSYLINNLDIIKFGTISPKLLKNFDIKQPVFYCEIQWQNFAKISTKRKTIFSGINNFPPVRRDLALLVNNDITFDEIRKVALKTEKKLLKSVGLFDVYEGDKIEAGKKSYAINFILQHDNKTLTDNEINSIMKKFIDSFEKELSAVIR